MKFLVRNRIMLIGMSYMATRDMNEAASIRLNVVLDPPIKFLIGRIYLLGEISTGRGEKFYDTVWKSLSEVFSFHMAWIVILI